METITSDMLAIIINQTDNEDVTYACCRCNKLLPLGAPFVKMIVSSNFQGYFCLACSRIHKEPILEVGSNEKEVSDGPIQSI